MWLPSSLLVLLAVLLLAGVLAKPAVLHHLQLVFAVQVVAETAGELAEPGFIFFIVVYIWQSRRFE